MPCLNTTRLGNFFKLLSLYSTATQNYLRWVPLRHLRRQVTQIFRVTLPKTPNTSQWNIGCVGCPPMPNLKFALPPTPTPDTSQWNIGGDGSPMQNFCVEHVHFMLLMSISFASGTQRKLVFQWNSFLIVIFPVLVNYL